MDYQGGWLSPNKTKGQLTWGILKSGFSFPARAPLKTLNRWLELDVGHAALRKYIKKLKLIFENVPMKLVGGSEFHWF